ncbi:MAG TPA: MerR family transcriptional regulator [Acidimicrobiales bacterium]|nr:MerR family transcriptional regulator [Acidimicrobiales bacterium]
MTRAPTDRSHLSIGEVLSLLQEEFPDVTISKIRFLESQGLLDPERTPSGYRKFYEGDIDRLRWILRQQKDHYLPLKVIKDRLDEAVPRSPVRAAGAGGTARDAALRNGDAGAGTTPRTAVALDERPGGGTTGTSGTTGTTGTTGSTIAAQSLVEGPSPDPRPSAEATRPRPMPPASPTRASDPARRFDIAGAAAATPAGGTPRAPEAGTVSLTPEELAQQSGLTLRDLRDLERYGLVEGFEVGDATYYDADALVVAQTAAGFLRHGIEARHMRTYKVAIDRESGLFEQIVLPLLKQRNPEARQRARETVTELIRLGQQMRGVLLHQALRDHVEPS